MATSLSDDLRRALRADGNALHRLILYNVLVFVGLVLVRVVCEIILRHPAWYAAVHDLLVLPSWVSGPQSLPTRPWTIITYAFTHEAFFHILFNMLNLYWFGQLIVEYLNARRLVSLYVLGALAGALMYLLALNLVPELAHRFPLARVEGASGAVLAVIVAAATLLPDYTFMLLLLGPVRIKWIAAVLVLLSVSGLTGGNAGGAGAHLGGAILGFVYIKQLQAGRDLGAPLQRAWAWLTGLFSPAPAPRAASARSTATTVGTPTADEATIDRILDKINRSGYESLTKDEKQQLFRASKK